MFVLIAILGVSAAYTYLHASLFASGQFAAAGGGAARTRGRRES